MAGRRAAFTGYRFRLGFLRLAFGANPYS